jgi:hypothetical protein
MLKCTFVQDQLNLCSATQISPKVPESALRQVMVLRQKKKRKSCFWNSLIQCSPKMQNIRDKGITGAK